MPANPRFHKQSLSTSCVPACVRMVLECFGHFVPEAYLREICGWDDDGTEPSKVVEAVCEHFSLANSRSDYLTLEELQNELSQNLHPIVYLDLLGQGSQNCHAVIVVKIMEDNVFVIDPEIGKSTLTKIEFTNAWSRAHGRTIVIEQ